MSCRFKVPAETCSTFPEFEILVFQTSLVCISIPEAAREKLGGCLMPGFVLQDLCFSLKKKTMSAPTHHTIK